MTDATKATPPEAAKASSSSEDTSKPKIKRVALKDLGPTLPLGVVDSGGKLARSIECRRWRGAEEREVGRIQNDSKERGDFLSRLMGFMYTRVGDHDFEKMSEPEKQAIVGQMHMGDVFYMYVWLRTKCVGMSLKMDLTCPRCNFEFPFDADLSTVEVRTAESLADVKWTYDLIDPFDLRGQKATGFELGPVKWIAMEESIRKALESGGTNVGLAKMDVIQNCIQGVKGRDPMVLTERELDELTKMDIETLVARIDEHEVGPDMSVETKCQRCKRSIRTSLDWGYESFFEVSSPS